MKITNLLQNYKEYINKDIEIVGWVRSFRTQGESFSFCSINDGSCPMCFQIIIKVNMKISTGSCIKAIGKVVLSPAKGQVIELSCNTIEIIGDVQDSSTYPIAKKKLTMPYLRQFCHLRGRTNTMGCVFRIRNTIMYETHRFFQNKGYLNLDPNVITINECEGGAGVFQLTEWCPKICKDIPMKEGYIDWSEDHFKKPAYLTVSSQLQLEAMACSMGDVYTMNKSFRSEHSDTNKHVSEFTHLEIEIVNNSFKKLMDIAIEYIDYIVNSVYTTNYKDIETLNKFMCKGLIDKYNVLKDISFTTIKYCDAIKLLKRKKKFKTVTYGEDLSSEMENWLVSHFKGGVFVTHWPSDIKSFYMRQVGDGTCESFDLLMPYGIGELIGGSQREERYHILLSEMNKKNISTEDLSFYLDLRKYGTIPHGGFGLGIDRLIMMLSGMTSIKDVIPFPVYYGNCHY